jgi:CheY-like chemotaxis protein
VDEVRRTPKASSQTREHPAVRPRAGRHLVMVLEDDWATCDAFKDALEDAGFDTVCLPNGELGLDHLIQHPAPAAIVLDLMMPVMDGWTFVSRMRAIPDLNDIPVLVTTAAGAHWGYPCSPVLRKPVGRNELVASLRTLIEASLRRRSGS